MNKRVWTVLTHWNMDYYYFFKEIPVLVFDPKLGVGGYWGLTVCIDLHRKLEHLRFWYLEWGRCRETTGIVIHGFFTARDLVTLNLCFQGSTVVLVVSQKLLLLLSSFEVLVKGIWSSYFKPNFRDMYMLANLNRKRYLLI